MAYTAPTEADLRARFPAFCDVQNDPITAALSDAALMVDDTWVSQEDFTAGRLLYAAHILTLDGHGSGAEAEQAKAGALQFTEMRSGALTLKRADMATSGGDTLSLTTFGRRFLEILHRNRAGPIAVCK